MIYTASAALGGFGRDDERMKTMKAVDYKKVVNDRAIRMGKHMIETRCTFSTLARDFSCSPSTARRLIRVLLPNINSELANQCKTIIDYHKSISHLRGGEANKMRIRKQKLSVRPNGHRSDRITQAE